MKLGKRNLLIAAAVSLAIDAAYAQTPKLPEVVVVESPDPGPPVEQTTAGPVKGYQALTGTSATRTETPLEQIPQSINVITRSLMTDQNNLSVSEALRNVSGVQGTNALQTPAYDSTYIRGFAAEQWLDGISTYYNAGNRDSLINAERVEVLKGPNAIIYGGGVGSPVGGVVNVVSKLPTSNAFYHVGIIGGSHNYYQPFFDVNQPLNEEGTILFRMTGAYTSAGSFVDVVDTKAYSIFPTLTFTNRTDTTLTIQARYSDWKQQEYQGLPATGTLVGPFRINSSLFIGPADIPKSYSKVQSGTVALDHSFNEVWSANIQARASKTEFAEYVQTLVGGGFSFAANTPSVPPSSWNLLNALLSQEQNEVTVAAHTLAKFNAGPTQNKLLLGLDYSRLTDNGAIVGNLADLFTLGFVNLANPNPVFPPYVPPAGTPANTFSDGDNTYTTTGAYAQIQTSVWNRLHLLAGLRVTNLKIDSVSPAFARTDVTDTTKVLPRIGAAYEIVHGLSAFAGYSEGLKANPFVFYVGTPKPEESKQAEGGIKFNTNFGLSGSAAIFQIDRTAVPVFTGIASEAIGEQRSRGFDTDVLWQPNRNWQFLANYAHIDATFTKTIPGVALAGNHLNIVPQNSGRFWANYKFNPGPLGGWRVGAGVYAASGAYVDNANTFKTEGYYTVDSTIAYETKHFDASFSVKNLTGQNYYVPYSYFGGRVAPIDDTTFYAKVAFKF